MRHNDLIVIVCKNSQIVIKGDGGSFNPRDIKAPAVLSHLANKAIVKMKEGQASFCLIDAENAANTKTLNPSQFFCDRKSMEEAANHALFLLGAPRATATPDSVIPEPILKLAEIEPGRVLRLIQRRGDISTTAFPVFNAALALAACINEAKSNYWKEVLVMGDGPTFPSLKGFLWKNFETDGLTPECRLPNINQDERFEIIESHWRNIISEGMFGGQLVKKGGIPLINKYVCSILEAKKIKDRLTELYRKVPDEIQFFTHLNPSDLSHAVFSKEVVKLLPTKVLEAIFSGFYLLDSPTYQELLEMIEKKNVAQLRRLEEEKAYALMSVPDVSNEDKQWLTQVLRPE